MSNPGAQKGTAQARASGSRDGIKDIGKSATGCTTSSNKRNTSRSRSVVKPGIHSDVVTNYNTSSTSTQTSSPIDQIKGVPAKLLPSAYNEKLFDETPGKSVRDSHDSGIYVITDRNSPSPKRELDRYSSRDLTRVDEKRKEKILQKNERIFTAKQSEGLDKQSTKAHTTYTRHHREQLPQKMPNYSAKDWLELNKESQDCDDQAKSYKDPSEGFFQAVTE